MDWNEKKERKQQFSNIAYYLIIGLISIIVTGFVPMLSSEIGLDWNLPNTSAGWAVWIISKLCVAVVNMLLFYCFMEQAKINVKDNPKYIEARELINKALKNREVKPHSPGKWNRKQYLSKGSTLFLTTILSTIGLSQAVLTFDITTFLTMLFTIIMGVTFGYLQMRKAEDYWTNEFYEYAKIFKEEEDKKAEEAQKTVVEENKEEETKCDTLEE